MFSRKSSSRREVCMDRAASRGRTWNNLRAGGVPISLGIAAALCVLATAIVLPREQVVRYRPGQYVPHDIVARVDFIYPDHDLLTRSRRDAWQNEPRVYKSTGDVWTHVQEELAALP